MLRTLLVLEQLGARVHPLVRVERLLVRPAGEDREEPEEGGEDQDPGRPTDPAGAAHAPYLHGRSCPASMRRAPAVSGGAHQLRVDSPGAEHARLHLRRQACDLPARTRARASRGSPAAARSAIAGRACPSGSGSRSAGRSICIARAARSGSRCPAPIVGPPAPHRHQRHVEPDPRWAISSNRSVSPRNATLAASLDRVADRQGLASASGSALRAGGRPGSRGPRPRRCRSLSPTSTSSTSAKPAPRAGRRPQPRGRDDARRRARCRRSDRTSRWSWCACEISTASTAPIAGSGGGACGAGAATRCTEHRVRQHAAAVHLDEHRRVAEPGDLQRSLALFLERTSARARCAP